MILPKRTEAILPGPNENDTSSGSQAIWESDEEWLLGDNWTARYDMRSEAHLIPNVIIIPLEHRISIVEEGQINIP
jgi:hypothetical protein